MVEICTEASEYLKPVLVRVAAAVTVIYGVTPGDGETAGVPGQNLPFLIGLGLDD
jgi:hypothetical protein